MDAIEYEQIISVGCGLDIHKDLMVATVRSSTRTFQTKEFGGYTSSLTSLRDWLKDQGVTHIAMESTGVYWMPVFNILEEDFQIILVNARHVKNVPGHKTDKNDSIWISKLLLSGLLKASFIPKVDIRELRDLVRYREKIVAENAREKNRIIKTLESCNIKLSSVLTNVDGATGTKIIKDIIDGKFDIDQLMTHYHGKIKVSKKEFRQALEGRITAHHQFILKIIRESMDYKDILLDKLDLQINEQVKNYEVEIGLLESIPGVGRQSAIELISEIGVDMSLFPNEHHLASWAGLSPGNNETGGKKKSQKQ
jgi:transposase